MKNLKYFMALTVIMMLLSCNVNKNKLSVEVFETSANGNKLTKIAESAAGPETVNVKLLPDIKFQTITGFGGAFTESSAYLLNKLSKRNRDLILDAYFGPGGARYSLTRTHINSCDFSLKSYSYDTVKGDKGLQHFSISHDMNDLIPMIKDAMTHSKDGFKIIASPWTAPPWMKDNNDYRGGKLLPEYYDTWALYFSKYISAYKKEGIDIWGLTVENEPLGNGGQWESMIFTPGEMVDFVYNHMGPKLLADGHKVKILAYDQNRGDELEEWAKVIYKDDASKKYFDGFAVHWYASTFDWFPKSLTFTHELAPNKFLIQTEACVDAQVPHWQDDAWYWSKEATDWGYFWAPDAQKSLHPKYVPVYRYARDIIGCLNNWVDGWVDWNMVLDRQGGPNSAKNWCVAPIIVDPAKDRVYITPLYYAMAHFSKFIRPGAVRIGFENPDTTLMVTAAQNPDGEIVAVVLNMDATPRNLRFSVGKQSADVKIDARAIQTVLIKP